MNEALIKLIDKEARGIRNKILKKQKPAMKFPLRNLSNVKFDPKAGFFQIGRKTKERTLAVATVKTFAQSLKMIALSKNLIETDDIATKREAYYVAKGWDEEVRFAAFKQFCAGSAAEKTRNIEEADSAIGKLNGEI